MKSIHFDNLVESINLVIRRQIHKNKQLFLMNEKYKFIAIFGIAV